jgi:hypothetical protein
MAAFLMGVLYLLGGLLGLVLLLHAFAWCFIGKCIRSLVDPWLRDSADVTVRRGRDLVFEPRGAPPRAGLVFHPGGYGDPEAYARVFHEVARHARLRCVIVPGPQRTPIANRFSTDRVLAEHADIGRWFIAGHSQGGAVAALYLRDRLDQPAVAGKIAGLVFLGFFVFDRHSLAARALPCLSVYGDRDGHAERFKPNEKNLPAGAKVVCIEGGNHGQFGAYGLHFPDGTPTISREAQQDRTIAEIVEFVDEHGP